MRRWADKWLVAAGLAGLLAAGWGLERVAAFQTAKAALRDPTVPTALLNRGSLGRLLRHLRLVRPVPNDGSLHPKSAYAKTALDASLFQKKRVVGGWLYESNPDWVEDWTGRTATHSAVDPAWLHSGLPLLALDLAAADMNDLLNQPKGHGKEWERPAALAFHRDGQRVFADRVGVRLHGGRSRLPGRVHSYRVYLREEYGPAHFAPEWIGGATCRRLSRFVIRADWPARYPFAGLLALDVAERLGCTVPRTQPVELVLNGQLQTNVYHLSEHVGRTAWAERLGHKDFWMFIYKGQSEKAAEEAYGGWSHRVIWDPLDYEGLEREADLDNLCAYIFAVAYAGVTDGFQGAAIRNLRDERPRWTWINWDMDHGFWDFFGDRIQRPAWEQESWELVFKRAEDRNYAFWRTRGDVRSILFARLMDEVPAFRERFLRFAVDSLNHRLTDVFMAARIDRYEELARAFGRADLGFIEEYREFARQRPAVLRAGLQRLFAAGELRRVDVRVPADAPLRIDGFDHVGPYSGIYFDGQKVAIEWAGPAEGFRGWMLDGAPAEDGSRLECAVDGDRTIAFAVAP